MPASYLIRTIELDLVTVYGQKDKDMNQLCVHPAVKLLSGRFYRGPLPKATKVPLVLSSQHYLTIRYRNSLFQTSVGITTKGEGRCDEHGRMTRKQFFYQ